MADDGTQYTLEELGHVHIVNDRLYDHKTMRVNYTTYDMRREYNILNPRVHANVMAVSPLFDHKSSSSEDGHPFVYARVLGIYHAEVIHTVPGQLATAHTVEVLFVRWYRRDVTYKAGFQHRRLHRLEFIESTDASAFGFLDPDDVIRGCHIIPVFTKGKNDALVKASRIWHSPRDDWKYFYVNLYAFLVYCLLIDTNAPQFR